MRQSVFFDCSSSSCRSESRNLVTFASIIGDTWILNVDTADAVPAIKSVPPSVDFEPSTDDVAIISALYDGWIIFSFDRWLPFLVRTVFNKFKRPSVVAAVGDVRLWRRFPLDDAIVTTNFEDRRFNFNEFEEEELLELLVFLFLKSKFFLPRLETTAAELLFFDLLSVIEDDVDRILSANAQQIEIMLIILCI